jgi:hypothetical protein
MHDDIYITLQNIIQTGVNDITQTHSIPSTYWPDPLIPDFVRYQATRREDFPPGFL